MPKRDREYCCDQEDNRHFRWVIGPGTVHPEVVRLGCMHGSSLLCELLLLAPNYQLIGFNDKVTAVIGDIERLEDLGVLLKAVLE